MKDLRTEVLENRRQIIDNRAETIGCFANVWDNLMNMREALSLSAYPRKKKRPATFSPPSRGPIIDPEAVKLQTVMERSKKEHEEQIRTELDPKGKGVSGGAEEESSDED